MIAISLGQRIRELRDKAGLSLRKLADQIDISSPFLSDIELGRRLPSEEILVKLAAALDVSPDELKQYDTRGPIADLKCLIDSDPKLGFAFRTMSRRWSKNFQFDARYQRSCRPKLSAEWLGITRITECSSSPPPQSPSALSSASWRRLDLCTLDQTYSEVVPAIPNQARLAGSCSVSLVPVKLDGCETGFIVSILDPTSGLLMGLCWSKITRSGASTQTMSIWSNAQ
jgi:transcriptional regulator with XRE-family HTH domain